MTPRALITAGPTRARLDAVRFVMNTSSGALGAAIAAEGLARGWLVDFVSGSGSVRPPAHAGLTIHPVSWLSDLEPVLRRLSETGAFSAVFHAMAVMDFAPSEARLEKRSSGAPWTIELHPTRKVIDRFRVWFPDACLVGFKLETGINEGELVSRAARLARRCGADIVVANLLEWVETGYRCLVVDRDGIVWAEVAGREATAAWLWRHVEAHHPVPVPATGGR